MYILSPGGGTCTTHYERALQQYNTYHFATSPSIQETTSTTTSALLPEVLFGNWYVNYKLPTVHGSPTANLNRYCNKRHFTEFSMLHYSTVLYSTLKLLMMIDGQCNDTSTRIAPPPPVTVKQKRGNMEMKSRPSSIPFTCC